MISSGSDVKTPCSENHEEKYGIPALDQLGHNTASVGEERFPGGEQEALKRLDEHMKRTVFQYLVTLLYHCFIHLREGG